MLLAFLCLINLECLPDNNVVLLLYYYENTINVFSAKNMNAFYSLLISTSHSQFSRNMLKLFFFFSVGFLVRNTLNSLTRKVCGGKQ